MNRIRSLHFIYNVFVVYQYNMSHSLHKLFAKSDLIEYEWKLFIFFGFERKVLLNLKCECTSFYYTMCMKWDIETCERNCNNDKKKNLKKKFNKLFIWIKFSQTFKWIWFSHLFFSLLFLRSFMSIICLNMERDNKQIRFADEIELIWLNINKFIKLKSYNKLLWIPIVMCKKSNIMYISQSLLLILFRSLNLW